MLKIAVCDHEPLAAGQLEQGIAEEFNKFQQYPEIEMYYTSESLLDALRQGEYYDLIFMDISLNSSNQISIGELLRGEMSLMEPLLIYLSNKPVFSQELFRAEPFDFLLKPVLLKELERCVRRAETRLSIYQPSVFEFRSRQNLVRIPYRKILYFQGCNHRITIATEERCYECYDTIDQIYRRVETSGFLMVSRSHIVNSAFIEDFGSERLYLTNGEAVDISRPRRKDVRQRYIQYVQTG